ncbi:MAG: PHP domain-containing protein [Anaerolineaceae bacterium]|nr:PHP domain-containing protein [Anaerolineaceae bacterium]
MNSSKPTVRAELHLHTCYSHDSLMPLEKMIERARELGIDRLAVTDHNVIEGALAAQKLAPDLIIVGEEIQTTRGEFLGYFVTELVPEGLTPKETIERLKAQGAVISVAHPFDSRGNAPWGWDELAEFAPDLDAVEVFNARCLTQDINNKAKAFAEEFGLAGAAGSDAHSIGEIGTANLRLPEFHTAEEFRKALKVAEVQGRLSSPTVRLISRHAEMKKKIQHS